jgi:hypothetical protein
MHMQDLRLRYKIAHPSRPEIAGDGFDIAAANQDA